MIHAVRVVNAYRHHIHTLNVVAGRHASQAWMRSGGDRQKWTAAQTTISTAARRSAAAATVGMHGLLLGATPRVDVDSIVAAPTDAWDNPPDRFDRDRADGMLVAAALAAGALRAASAAATDITEASRSTAVLIDQGEERITGYGRCLSPRACQWCAEVAMQDYRTAETASAPNHDGRCNCTVIPIVGELNPARTINAPLRDLADSAYVTDEGEAADRPEEPAD